MLRYCAILFVVGGSFAYPRPSPQHQYQQAQQPEGVPPHLLRQYFTAQHLASNPQTAQVQLRPTQVAPPAAPAPVRLPYVPEPQYQQQQPQYRQQYQPQREQEQEREQQEDYDHNPSYQFGFDVNDDQYTNYQNRKEQREGNVIKGSYSVVDSDGFIRTVTYTADPKEGFKAEVSRQPTDIVVKIPTPKPQLAQQQQQQQQYSQQQQQQQYSQQQAQTAPQQYYRYQQ